MDGCEAVLRTVPKVSPFAKPLKKPFPTKARPTRLPTTSKCAGLALGSPTRFGNMAAAMKYFIDGTIPLWLGAELVGKPATVFTSTSSLHGGQETTLLTMMLPVAPGMVITAFPIRVRAQQYPKRRHAYGASHVPAMKQAGIDAERKRHCLRTR
ncbi:NAD(P)H-dependent oxidoreductase [Neisseria subflava]|uniref:NAD(P)H-dependent oxidoreductase n=1 Tax=Neisseria subflava TaxID=28449 RepID=UPI00202A4046